ncbi:penicillin acylase family protein [Hankyongella ginsenosidimutans]|uniref:penicillin acylase family protein n=1 Tax=Hankyongella ginsenosidimutans TaxID=1763828 RepID=UPI001CA36806|nr:penicillin acylase family protein [Hankyongella ginsenosidimutans]
MARRAGGSAAQGGRRRGESSRRRRDPLHLGAVNKPQVNHPLSAILPPIGWLTDPKPVAVPGSGGTPRVDSPQHGASERFSVSPGHEADGLFQMPGGQSGYPWSPYYLAGHKDWLMGNPRPFLPGTPKWQLEFRPRVRTH